MTFVYHIVFNFSLFCFGKCLGVFFFFPIFQGKQDGDENEAVEIARYTRGQYFGELALVTNKPRAASAFALGTVKCLGNGKSFYFNTCFVL